jgi:DNA-binding CsgD family transcriptional regulator
MESLPWLGEGLEQAERTGARPLAERARRELIDAGARPHRPAHLGRDVLTPSELRVAQMAAEGATNKEIAQGLFVSLRTVETHLTHAYAKLGIAARGELVGALAANSAQRPGPAGAESSPS